MWRPPPVLRSPQPEDEGRASVPRLPQRGGRRGARRSIGYEDPEVLTLGHSAKFLGVSETTVKNLVASGELKKAQVVPWAPWEIKKADLSSERIVQIVDCLRRSGKLILGVNLVFQKELFEE